MGQFNVLTDDFLVDGYPIVVPGYMGDQSYTLGEARHFIQGLENLELLDPLNLFEYGGTDRQDEISGFSNAALVLKVMIHFSLILALSIRYLLAVMVTTATS